jgi:hypothetical protein
MKQQSKGSKLGQTYGHPKVDICAKSIKTAKNKSKMARFRLFFGRSGG